MQDPYIEFYNSLATLTESGSTMTEAITIVADTQPRHIRNGMQRTVTALEQGDNLQEALDQSGVLDFWEIRMLVAGERSGHLPETCRNLGKIREQRSRYIKNLTSKIAYPIFVIHLAILAPSLYILITKGGAAYLNTVGPILLILYAAFATPFILYRISRISPILAKMWDYFILYIPLVSPCVLKYHLSNAVRLLHSFYSAGITIRDAMEELAKLSPNLVLRDMFIRIYCRLQEGQPLEVAIHGEYWMPSFLRNLIVTGNKAGHLEEHLARGLNYLEEQAQTSINRLITIVSSTIFVVAAVFVAYKVISFYSAYMQQLLQMLPSYQQPK